MVHRIYKCSIHLAHWHVHELQDDTIPDRHTAAETSKNATEHCFALRPSEQTLSKEHDGESRGVPGFARPMAPSSFQAGAGIPNYAPKKPLWAHNKLMTRDSNSNKICLDGAFSQHAHEPTPLFNFVSSSSGLPQLKDPRGMPTLMPCL